MATTLFTLIGKVMIETQDAVKGLGDTTSKAEKSESKISAAFKKIGLAAAAAFSVDKIKDFGLACIETAAEAGAMESQFTQVFGDLEKSASTNLGKIAKNTGIVENRMKGSYTKIAAFAKTTGMETADALSLADRAMMAVADSAAFYDRTLEETTESLQSFLKGNFENDSALGLSCTETTRNTAANKLYGKSFKDLSESQKQLTLLQMVEDANKTSGALGQASRESDTWSNQLGNLKQSWADLQQKLGEPILGTAIQLVKRMADGVSDLTQKFKDGKNPVEGLMEKAREFGDWCKDIGEYASTTFKPAIERISDAFSDLKEELQPLIDKFTEYVESGEATEDITNVVKDAIDALTEIVIDVVDNLEKFAKWCKDNEETVEDIAIVIGALAGAWLAVNTAMTAYTTITTIAAAVTTVLTSPILAIVAAVGLVCAAIALWIKHWDDIKLATKMVCEEIKWWFEDVKDSVGEIADNIKDKFETAIEKIKGFFDFKAKLPDIELPHFNISPSGWQIGDLLEGSIPELGIEWYAKGAVLNEPTAFGINPASGNIMAGGEAGAEAVAPISTLQKYVKDAVDASNVDVANRISEGFNKLLAFLQQYIPELANMQIVMDSGAMVAELAPAMDAALGKMATKTGRMVL
jgi:hypothetical protein